MCDTLKAAMDEMPESDWWGLVTFFADLEERAPDGARRFLRLLGREFGESGRRRHPNPPPPDLQEFLDAIAGYFDESDPQ